MSTIKRSFVATVDVLRKGNASDELTDHLRALVLAVQASGKSGTLSLTIKVKAGKGGPLEITDDIKCVMPKADKASTYLYPTDEGDLSRSDPAQGELPGIRSVDEPVSTIRPVAAA